MIGEACVQARDVSPGVVTAPGIRISNLDPYYHLAVRTPQDAAGASVVTHYQVKPEAHEAFARAKGDVSRGLSGTPDYDGYETYADATGSQQTVVRRFHSAAAAHAWLDSPAHADTEGTIAPLCSSPAVSNVLITGTGTDTAGASLVSTTLVKSGQDGWFAEWQGRMGAAQQQFPGYVGQRVQAPIPGVNPDWVSIIAFDTEEHLRHWSDSPERKALVAESTPHIERFAVRPANSAFESWFASSERGVKPPPGWKLSAIVLLVLYPIVMLEVFTLNHILKAIGVETALSIFIGNAISVAITGFLLIPWASKLLNWWLVPPESSAAKRTAIGAGLVIGLYAVSVIIFAILIAVYPQLLP